MPKEVNVLGDSQREQWKSVVHMLRVLGDTRKVRDALCDEIERYIDHCEDVFDEIRKENENV